MADTYHHGDVRAAFLRRTADVVTTSGVHAVSMRAIAADVGVSHTAPRHHFGSRDGLLTALAAEGFDLLADRLAAVRDSGGSFLDIGVAYVEFARDHPGHFTVMYDPDVLVDHDPALLAAQQRTFGEIRTGVDSLDDERSKADMAAATIAGWSMMHGLVVLQRAGALERAHVAALLGDPPLPALAARVGRMLYGSPGDATRRLDDTQRKATS